MVFDDVLAVALTPWGLLFLGLVIGSFLNVVIHRLPLISEADWKVDARDILGLPEEPTKPEDVLTLSSPARIAPFAATPPATAKAGSAGANAM